MSTNSKALQTETIEVERPESGDFWFAMVDLEVIRDKKLSPLEKAVYAVLCAAVDVRTRQEAMTIARIKEEVGCSTRSAQSAIKALVARGVLERRERFKNGRQLASTYRIVGHRAACYKKAEEKPAEQTPPDETAGENGNGANSAGGAVFCTPEGAESADRYLEPLCFENLSSPPTPPREEEKGLEDFALEGGQPETQEEKERRFCANVTALYGKILPELPKAQAPSKSRLSQIRSLIRGDPARRQLDWWRRYFERAREFPVIMGDAPGIEWHASLSWLLLEKNMVKVLEGTFSRYSSRSGGSESGRSEQQKYTNEGGEVDVVALLQHNRSAQH